MTFLYRKQVGRALPSKSAHVQCATDPGTKCPAIPPADFLQPWSPAMKQQHSCRYVEFPFVGELSNQHGIDWGNARYDPGIVKKVWLRSMHSS